jgi:CRISPR-associated protein Cst2
VAQQLTSVSIAARLTLDMHSLNNEGGEGNQIATRMVDIVGDDGRLHNVNAISGDMLKHIQAQHLFHLAREARAPLCGGCARFDANRANADVNFTEEIKGLTDGAVVSRLIERCIQDDAMGILITANNRSVPRKAVVEFGWVLGIPEVTRTDSYFHVKYATERGETERRTARESQEATGSNLGQAIFHRPASSGVYALVCHMELSRIGYNDITQRYVIDEEQRRLRGQLVLTSLLHTLVELNGAMRSSQLPHLVAAEGVVSLSETATPAPLVSPLAGSGGDEERDYRRQTKQVVSKLDTGGRLQAHSFDSLAQFSAVMRTLIDESVPANVAPAAR